MQPILARVRHWKIVFGPVSAVIGVPYFLLGVLTTIRDNLLPPVTRAQWDTYKFIPHWSLSAWIAVGLGVVLAGALEGSYRQTHASPGPAATTTRIDERTRLIREARAIVARTRELYDAGMRPEPLNPAGNQLLPGETQEQFDAKLKKRQTERFIRRQDETLARFVNDVRAPATRLRDELRAKLLLPPKSRPTWADGMYLFPVNLFALQSIADDLEMLALEVEEAMKREAE